MRKIYLSIAFAATMVLGASAQNDTILWQNFEDPNLDVNAPFNINYPSGDVQSTEWYNFDADGLADASTNGTRPNQWWLTLAFADQDTTAHYAVLTSNSWLAAPALVKNYFITPSFYAKNATLSWYSAPFQTPLFMDGYKVLVSTTNNDLLSFTTTIFTAAEYVSFNGGDSSLYSSYTFAPASNAFVHGANGQGIYLDPTDSDARRNRGVLVKHTVDLAQFNDQNIFICFLHECTDDNLLSIDDILVKGTFVDPTSVENVSKGFDFNMYPNPVTDNMSISFKVEGTQTTKVSVMDNSGRIVKVIGLGSQTGNQLHNIDMSDLTAGFYTLSVETEGNRAVKKFIKL